MKLTFAQRNEIFRKIRSILVRYWVDLGFLSIHVSEQTAYIKGSLKRLPGVPEQLSGVIVEAMLGEIKHIHGLTRVQAQFDNWDGSVSSGGWHPREGEAVSNWDRGRSNAVGAEPTFIAKDIPKEES